MCGVISKKELQQRYGLADTTVVKTLKACGLSTAKRRYTEAEIEERFSVARHLLGGGMTYAEVEDYFSLKVALTPKDDEQWH